MKWLNWLLVAAMAFAFIGCEAKKAGEEKKADAKPQTKEQAAGKEGEAISGDEALAAAKEQLGKIEGADEALAKGEDALKAAAALGNKDATPLTLEEYEQLLLGLSACTLDEDYIDRDCEAWKTFQDRKSNQSNAIGELTGGMSGLCIKHLSHESTTVRWYCATQMGGFLGSDDAAQNAVIAAVPVEKDPLVVAALVDSVGSSAGRNPAIAKMLIAAADHADENVRRVAGGWLASSWANGSEGTLEKAISMVENDASEKVRASVCWSLAAREDDAVVALYEKMTTAEMAKDHSNIYSDCMRGLAGMWADTPLPDKPSEKAFDLYVQRLNEKDCTDDKPSWGAISYPGYASDEEFPTRAPWWNDAKKQQIIAALANVVGCHEANSMARSGAIDTLEKLGAPKEVFATLRDGYEPLKEDFDHKRIYETLVTKAQ